MENNIIMVRDLGFDYGDGWVFHKLNLDIAEGDFVAVIGAVSYTHLTLPTK